MRRLFAVVVVALVASAPAHAAVPAWRALIDDWYDGHIDRTYPCAAYDEAIRHLPVDSPTYSNVREDILRAKRAAGCSKRVPGALRIGPVNRRHRDWLAPLAGVVALAAAATAGRLTTRPVEDRAPRVTLP